MSVNTLNDVQFVSLAEDSTAKTLLRHGIKVNVDAGQPLSTVVWGIEIVPGRVLVLFRPGTALFRFGLGTFFVPEPDLAKHFR